jgi:uncharacterized protein
LTSTAAPGATRVWGQVAAVVALAIVGSVAGAATPWLALGPIMAMLLPLLAATGFLYREGLTWRDLGFLRRMRWRRFLWLTGGAAVTVVVLAGFVITPLLRLMGLPPPDPTLLVDVVQGDLTNYLLFLIPVSWGSAAFGEELLLRGFLFNRFAIVYGTTVALVLQALVFSLGHTYQGIGGVMTLFAVGVILGWFYLRAGRNLWPVIAAHGLIDTLSITLVYLGYATPPAGMSP